MKKALLLGLCLLFITMGAGCDQTEPLPTPTKEPSKETVDTTQKKKIALVMKTLTNPFFIEMEKGARKAEQELGIDLLVKTGAKETSIEQQIAIVEELTQNKVDAIVIAPGSSTELIPALKKAQDQGIKIVNIDNMLDIEMSKKLGLLYVPFISVDNEEGAYKAAKIISDQITTKTEVAVIEGIRGAENAEQRKNGAMRAFKENANISVVASETANWKIDEAQVVTAGIFAKNPNVKAIFCANDMMALGTVQYLESVKKEGIMVGGFDALEEAKSAIQKGKMVVTINQQADVQGYTGVKYAFDMLNGKEMPLKTMVDVMVIQK
jgi:ribose transport system substrate-binding protein